MPDRLKVIIINKHPQDSLGGSEIQCDIIASKLLAFGHDVVYIALKGKGSYKTEYPVIKVALKGRDIANLVIKEKPDIVYWRHNKKVFYSSVKRIKKAGIPVIFAVSHIGDTKKWRSLKGNKKSLFDIRYYASNFYLIIKAYWNHKGFKYIDGLTVNNKSHLSLLNVKLKEYIPNSNTTSLEKFQWNKPYIVWVANLKARKRPEIYIELAKKLSTHNIDFLMIGNIQHKDYEYIRHRENLPNNLHYLGSKSVLEVNGVIKNSICLVHTCKPEGFPGNFIQSWLQGKPTVSLEFDPGGLIESKKMGFVSGNNMDQFIADTKKLIEDEELRQQLGENAYKYAMKHHNPETNVKKLLSFMREILDKQMVI